MQSVRNGATVLTGWVLDLLAARDGMEVWFRTATGDTVTLFAPFRPSFAVTGRGVRETAVRAAAGRWGCDVRKGEGVEFFSRRTVPAWTFAVPFEAILMSILLEERRAVRELSRRVEELERRRGDEP